LVCALELLGNEQKELKKKQSCGFSGHISSFTDKLKKLSPDPAGMASEAVSSHVGCGEEGICSRDSDGGRDGEREGGKETQEWKKESG
jgi:hypothetical protein